MPYATLRGPIDSNVFAIIGATSNTLKRAGFRPEAKEFTEKALKCASYHDVLALAQEYVEFDV